jgi:hypothetical protein
MLRNLLIYRMAIVNILFLAGLAWAWQMGFVADMFVNDRSYMTYAATALFALGTLSCFMRARKVSAILNVMKRGMKPVVNGVKFMEKSAHLDDVGDLIVVIGLTGTAIGVVMMLHSFNAGSLTDPAKVVETASMLSDGVGTAFRSTIVSSIAWACHVVNLRMLKTAQTLMIGDAK